MRLPPVANKRGGCGCHRSAAERSQLTANANNVKCQLLALPLERLQRLKSLLGVNGLILYVSGPGGVQKKTL